MTLPELEHYAPALVDHRMWELEQIDTREKVHARLNVYYRQMEERLLISGQK